MNVNDSYGRIHLRASAFICGWLPIAIFCGQLLWANSRMSAHPDPTTRRRFSEIDGLRGVAVMMVLLYHYTHQFRALLGQPFSARWDLDVGYMGVHLFFVISGFVIYMTVLRSASLWDFARKRILRLYPAYWICLMITFIVLARFATSIGKPAPTITEGLVGLSMLSQLFGIPWIDGAYWSLFVELSFYVLIAVALLTPLKKFSAWMAVVWLLAIAAHHIIGRMHVVSSFLCLQFGGFFLAGILFYKLKVEDRKDWKIHLILIATLAINLHAFTKTASEFSFVCAAYAAFWIYAFRDLPLLRNRSVQFLGWISYPLYLIHQEVGRIIISYLRSSGIPTPLDILGAIAVVILIATLVTRYGEPFVKGKLRSLIEPQMNGMHADGRR